jgi:PIN domain nuclease of toxin-antitoxin system
LAHVLAEELLAPRAVSFRFTDPFDRLRIAQARCENLTHLTADAAMMDYDVRTIDASR